jgi:hypothetical protein
VQWHHIIIAFLIGILFAYAFLTLSLRIGHPSSHLGPGSEQESPWGPQTQAARDSWDCSRRLAAIYPMAMGNLTAGSGQIAPDKLIVAARHTDVTPPPPPCATSYPHLHPITIPFFHIVKNLPTDPTSIIHSYPHSPQGPSLPGHTPLQRFRHYLTYLPHSPSPFSSCYSHRREILFLGSSTPPPLKFAGALALSCLSRMTAIKWGGGRCAREVTLLTAHKLPPRFAKGMLVDGSVIGNLYSLDLGSSRPQSGLHYSPSNTHTSSVSR